MHLYACNRGLRVPADGRVGDRGTERLLQGHVVASGSVHAVGSFLFLPSLVFGSGRLTAAVVPRIQFFVPRLAFPAVRVFVSLVSFL